MLFKPASRGKVLRFLFLTQALAFLKEKKKSYLNDTIKAASLMNIKTIQGWDWPLRKRF
jgi:hypothetical protein